MLQLLLCRNQKKQKYMKRILFLLITLIIHNQVINAQQFSQSIRGNIFDAASGEAIPFATIYLEDQPTLGTAADSAGHFVIKNVAVGRHTIIVHAIGYEPLIIKELMISSGKENYIEAALHESVITIGEVIVRPQIDKQQSINKMASTGARMLSIEEASRYAGGFGDPARLASSFAGVSQDGCTNGISIHGNAPHLLAWRIEGIEIPNPNHFADISVAGGGLMSSLSAFVLANSDFFTAAFPAEYGDAVSGVFDMKMRQGNNDKHEHTFQLGTLGIDFASEGPISKSKKASYIVNYRYSSLGLASRMNWIDMGGESIDYQDLNFKINLPTKSAGTFSIWGTGLIDKDANSTADTADWVTSFDINQGTITQQMGAIGLKHHILLPHGGQLTTTLAATANTMDADQKCYNFNSYKYDLPSVEMTASNTDLIVDVAHSQKLSARYTMKNGFHYTHFFYDIEMRHGDTIGQPLYIVFEGDGASGLLSAYTNHQLNLSNKLTLTAGVNIEYLRLNNAISVEPRMGLRWQPTERSTFAMAYGLHSRREKTDVYFVKIDNRFVNKDLDFTKAHHFMLSYSLKLTNNSLFKIEPFYQHLFNVPVEDGTSFSVLNHIEYYLDKALVNNGLGRNYGIDITLERYLKNGWYGMTTASIFSSRYRGGDGKWYHSRYDRGYVINILGGKEWMFGNEKQNVFALNAKLTIQGGDRHAPVAADVTPEEIIHSTNGAARYDETHAFAEQYSTAFGYNYSARLTINKQHVSHSFVIDMTHSRGYYDHVYNFEKHKIEPYVVKLTLPNIAYKIEF